MMGYLKKNVSMDTACGWRNAAIEVVMRSSIICCLLLVFHILSNVTANWGNFGNTVEYCGYLKQILILSEIWDFTDSLSFVELLGLGVILLLFWLQCVFEAGEKCDGAKPEDCSSSSRSSLEQPREHLCGQPVVFLHLQQLEWADVEKWRNLHLSCDGAKLCHKADVHLLCSQGFSIFPSGKWWW